MPEICQTVFPEGLERPRSLPGVAQLEPNGWITVDDAYAAQMAYRETLLANERETVLATCAGSEAAQKEALEETLKVLKHKKGFEVGVASVRCPDGRTVSLDGPPLEVLAQLVQEDICLLERAEHQQEHVLTAGLLCFPASWLLPEKLGRPLMGVHAPVEEYDTRLGRAVQRMFDVLRPGRPIWRFNRLWYADAELFQPRSEDARREPVSGQTYNYLRMEKQSLVRLPCTGAVLFSIHTYVLHRSNVPNDVEERFVAM